MQRKVKRPVEASNNGLNEIGAESLLVEQRRHQLAEGSGLHVTLLPQGIHGHAESKFLVECLLISGQPCESDEKSAHSQMQHTLIQKRLITISVARG